MDVGDVNSYSHDLMHICGTKKHPLAALAVFFSFSGLPGMSENIIDVSNWRKIELFKTQMWACGVILFSLFVFLTLFLSQIQGRK